MAYLYRTSGLIAIRKDLNHVVLQCVVDFLPEYRMALSHEIAKRWASYALA